MDQNHWFEIVAGYSLQNEQSGENMLTEEFRPVFQKIKEERSEERATLILRMNRIHGRTKNENEKVLRKMKNTIKDDEDAYNIALQIRKDPEYEG